MCVCGVCTVVPWWGWRIVTPKYLRRWDDLRFLRFIQGVMESRDFCLLGFVFVGNVLIYMNGRIVFFWFAVFQIGMISLRSRKDFSLLSCTYSRRFCLARLRIRAETPTLSILLLLHDDISFWNGKTECASLPKSCLWIECTYTSRRCMRAFMAPRRKDTTGPKRYEVYNKSSLLKSRPHSCSPGFFFFHVAHL